MLETLIKYGVIFYVMGVVFAIGCLAKVISAITIRKMLRAAEEIQKSEHRLMKLMKAKFEHATMVSDHVQNVEVFVKKYLYEYRVLGSRLETWRSLTVKMSLLIAIIGLSGAAGCFYVYGAGERMFLYISVTLGGAILLWSFHMLSSERMRLEAVKTYTIDYLENVCMRRYEKTRLMAESVENEDTGIREAEVQEIAEEVESVTPEEIQSDNVKEDAEAIQKELEQERKEQEMRIRAILQEFLA